MEILDNENQRIQIPESGQDVLEGLTPIIHTGPPHLNCAHPRTCPSPIWDSDDYDINRNQSKKGTYRGAKYPEPPRPVVVESAGDQVVAHIGLHALGDFADRMELGEHLSARIPISNERAPCHDRASSFLVHHALMLAGGGESCADIEYLRAQADLFGQVPSDSTVYRTFHEITPEVREGIAGGFAEVRSEVWRRTAVTKSKSPIYLDVDAFAHRDPLGERAGDQRATTRAVSDFILCSASATAPVKALFGDAPSRQRRCQHRERPRVGPRRCHRPAARGDRGWTPAAVTTHHS